MIQELTQDDVVDILHGATVFGAGGGGALDEGFALLDLAVAAGKRFRMISLEDVPDTAVLCMPYLLGAVSDLPSADDTLFQGQHPLMRACDKMRAHIDTPVFGALACELGGSNTAVPFFIAAMTDTVVIDADPAGRAVPEITHSAFSLAGIPPAPIFAANAFGETMVLDDVGSDQRAENLVRALAAASGNDISAIDHVLPASALRAHLLPGTLSTSARMGKLLRDRTIAPADMPLRIAEDLDGKILFEGQVSDSAYASQDGFTIGHFCVSGHLDYAGQTLCIDVKNENIIARLDGEPRVTVPEIISVFDRHSGAVVANPDVSIGQDVTVLVLPAPAVFLQPDGLAAFGPAYLGLSQAFKPFT